MSLASQVQLALRPLRGAGRAGSVGETTLASVALLVLGFGLSVATARALGPTGRGIFTLTITIGGLALLVLGLGLQQALAYFVAHEPADAKRAVRLARMATVRVGVPAAALGSVLAATVAEGEVRVCLLIVSLTLPVGLAAQNLQGVLQGLQRLRRFNLVRTAPAAITTVIAVILAAFEELTPGRAVGAYAAGLVVGFLLAVRLGGGGDDARLSRTWVRAVMRYGVIVNLGSVAYQANRQLGVLVVGAAGTLSDVGRFGVALGYAAPVAVVASAIAMHALPEVAARQDAGAWRTVARRRLTLAVRFTAPIAAVMAAAAPLLVPAVFGAEFRPAVGAAQALCVALALLGVAHLMHEICRGVGAVGRSALVEGTGAVVGALALYLVVPSHGITGAAIASAATYALTCAALGLLILRLGRAR